MKIYFLINSPYPHYAGGIENWLYNVSERLSEYHEIVVVARFQEGYPIFYSDISERIKIHKFRTLRSYKFLRSILKSYLVLLDLYLGSYLMGKKHASIIKLDEKCCVIALDFMFCIQAALSGSRSNKNAKIISSVR